MKAYYFNFLRNPVILSCLKKVFYVIKKLNFEFSKKITVQLKQMRSQMQGNFTLHVLKQNKRSGMI